jgi:hypothetical protein
MIQDVVPRLDKLKMAQGVLRGNKKMLRQRVATHPLRGRGRKRA